MNPEFSIDWQFGGWPGLPPWLGWTVLLFCAGGGLALLGLFYRHTLRALTWRQRFFFTFLRGGFFLSLLFCLAGPARVERLYSSDHDSRPLAIVVDRSPSMTVPDARGVTRLAQALRVWKKVEPDALRDFSARAYFRFSATSTSAPDLEAAVTGPDSGGDTHLYDSLNQVLRDGPAGGYGGIVCLTDGLDTTDSTPEELTARALQKHSPLYFAVGENRQAAQETLLVREMSLPGHVLRQARFTATVLIEAHATRARDVPLSLWEGGKMLAQTQLHLHPGANLVPWETTVEAADQADVRHLEYRLGEGADSQKLSAAVPVVASEKLNILFYQGTLDWSFRYIDTALRSEPGFSIAGLFSPNLNMAQVLASPDGPALTAMPATADTLKPFQIVVLSNVFGNELTAAQQTALLDYVHGGGGLLFLLSDTAVAQTFSGTPLESVLPVIFEAPPRAGDHDASLAQFQDMMHRIGGVNADRESDFASDAQTQPAQPPLKNFALPPNAKRSALSALFTPGAGGTLQNAPQFSTYARVRGVKAGGEVLAVHPDDKTAENEPRALFVTQRFGQGQVTALLTDALWRWRLALPSTVHDPEIFWQQLFLALAPHAGGRGTGLRFVQPPFHAARGEPCAFRVEQVSDGNPTVLAISPGGQMQGIVAQPGDQPGAWTFSFTPAEPGDWIVQVADDQHEMRQTRLRVDATSHAIELPGLPPDVEGLRRLAESTGGALLNDGVPDRWPTAGAPNAATLISQHARPLWDNWAVLLLGLGCYAAELIWRRQAKLL